MQTPQLIARNPLDESHGPPQGLPDQRREPSQQLTETPSQKPRKATQQQLASKQDSISVCGVIAIRGVSSWNIWDFLRSDEGCGRLVGDLDLAGLDSGLPKKSEGDLSNGVMRVVHHLDDA